MSRAGHVPSRTCVGCGKRAPQADLLRFTRTDGGMQVTHHAPSAGRSAYVHRDELCWERFAKRKGPVRSLGCSMDRAQRLALVQQLTAIERSAMVRN